MTHNEVIELLPWYVNQTLSEGERGSVALHLSSCAACSSELEQYQTIGAAVVESATEVPAPAGDLFSRAMADIQHYEQAKAIAKTNTMGTPAEWLSRLGETLFGWMAPAPMLARAVVAAQFAVVLVLAGALGVSLWKQADYSTLSGSAAGRGDGTTLAIRFNENISEAQVRQTLAGIKGSIIAGPSALGIYTVEVPIAANQNVELEQLLQRLRANSQVVTYAEKLG